MALTLKVRAKVRWHALPAMLFWMKTGSTNLTNPSEDEEDMLDLAFGLTETSRLGCQIIMSDELDGLRVKLPAATRNMMVDK